MNITIPTGPFVFGALTQQEAVGVLETLGSLNAKTAASNGLDFTYRKLVAQYNQQVEQLKAAEQKQAAAAPAAPAAVPPAGNDSNGGQPAGSNGVEG